MRNQFGEEMARLFQSSSRISGSATPARVLVGDAEPVSILFEDKWFCNYGRVICEMFTDELVSILFEDKWFCNF